MKQLINQLDELHLTNEKSIMKVLDADGE